MEFCLLNLDDFIYRKEKWTQIDKSLSPYFKEIHCKAKRGLIILAIMMEINTGIAFMHKVGQVHRDLKPSNGIFD